MIGDRWGAEPPVEEPYQEVAEHLHPTPIGTPSTTQQPSSSVPLYVGLGLLAFLLLTSGRG